MSDSQVSESVLVPASNNGQPDRANDSTDLGVSEGQPSSGKVANDQDNIKKLQSVYDKKIAEERKAFQQQQQYAQQQIQAMQQRLAQMEESAAPDDYSRLELKLKRAEEQAQQYANAYQQAVAERQQQTERESALREIADEFDVPMSALTDASDYKSAVRLAIKAQQEAQRRKQQQDDDKSARNMPDIGSGAPRTASSQAEAEWQELVRNRDSVGQARWLRLHGGKR